MKQPRSVHEHVYGGNTARLVEWRIFSRADGKPIAEAVAILSPLTGDWLTVPTGTGPALALPTLCDARMYVLGGNGRRTRGHSEVTRVWEHTDATVDQRIRDIVTTVR